MAVVRDFVSCPHFIIMVLLWLNATSPSESLMSLPETVAGTFAGSIDVGEVREAVLQWLPLCVAGIWLTVDIT